MPPRPPGKEQSVAEREHDQDANTVRHEQELEVDVRSHEAGSVRARKHVEAKFVEHVEPRAVEHGELVRAPARDGDSGEIETLEDGSISIPLFEERLVVVKELVVRERVVVRKRTVTEHERIEAELRTERIEIEGNLENDPSE